jgi:hypothetical protein
MGAKGLIIERIKFELSFSLIISSGSLLGSSFSLIVYKKP